MSDLRLTINTYQNVVMQEFEVNTTTYSCKWPPKFVDEGSYENWKCDY